MVKHIFAVAVFAVCLFSFTVRAQTMRIEYDYDGTLGIFGIADSARAYLGSDLIGKAEALEIVDKEPGPNAIRIRETHYSPSGKDIYKGYLEIQFGFMAGR